MDKLSEKDIQSILAKHFWLKGHKICCSNFQGCGYAETDFMSFTNANFVYSFEIKISKSDFKNDFKNKKYKHSRLKESKTLTKTTGVPNYFYFVVPYKLVDLRSVPTYAGLIYINEENKIEVVKKAPRLHSKKCSTFLYKKVLKMFTERYIFGSSYFGYINKEKKKQREQTTKPDLDN